MSPGCALPTGACDFAAVTVVLVKKVGAEAGITALVFDADRVAKLADTLVAIAAFDSGVILDAEMTEPINIIEQLRKSMRLSEFRDARLERDGFTIVLLWFQNWRR